MSKKLQEQEIIFQKKFDAEKKTIQQKLEEDLRKAIHNDFENRLSILQQSNHEQQEKLKAARQKELEFLQKEQALKNKEEELELSHSETAGRKSKNRRRSTTNRRTEKPGPRNRLSVAIKRTGKTTGGSEKTGGRDETQG